MTICYTLWIDRICMLVFFLDNLWWLKDLNTLNKILLKASFAAAAVLKEVLSGEAALLLPATGVFRDFQGAPQQHSFCAVNTIKQRHHRDTNYSWFLMPMNLDPNLWSTNCNTKFWFSFPSKLQDCCIYFPSLHLPPQISQSAGDGVVSNSIKLYLLKYIISLLRLGKNGTEALRLITIFSVFLW